MSAVEQKMGEYKNMLAEHGLTEANEHQGYMVAGFVDGFRGGFKAASEAVVAALDEVLRGGLTLGQIAEQIESLRDAIQTGKVPE